MSRTQKNCPGRVKIPIAPSWTWPAYHQFKTGSTHLRYDDSLAAGVLEVWKAGRMVIL
jgi:hypothetical protein